jgi:hypothetical protein
MSSQVIRFVQNLRLSFWRLVYVVAHHSAEASENGMTFSSILLRKASFLVINIFLMASASRGVAQQLPPNEFPGCYSLTLGDWKPPISQSDLKFHLPPSVIRLTAETVSRAGQPTSWKIEPPITHQYSRGRELAAWTVTDSMIRLTWSDGFTGAWMELKRSVPADSLLGRVHALSDNIRPNPPQTSVVARRVECRQRSPGV